MLGCLEFRKSGSANFCRNSCISVERVEASFCLDSLSTFSSRRKLNKDAKMLILKSTYHEGMCSAPDELLICVFLGLILLLGIFNLLNDTDINIFIRKNVSLLIPSGVAGSK